MATEEGQVIACHTKEEFDSQMKKAEEAKKLVRAPCPRSPSPSCFCDSPVILGELFGGFVALGFAGSDPSWFLCAVGPCVQIRSRLHRE